jgi:hypothetical protein
MASVANAQVTLKTDVSGSVTGGSNASVNAKADVKAGASMKASTTPNASATSTLHANENSAVIRGNEPQGNAWGNASTTADTGTPRKVPARFLGIFPASITAKVMTDAEGSTTVKYPWYAFLFKLAAAVDAQASVK